jgi:hypothetical protein
VHHPVVEAGQHLACRVGHHRALVVAAGESAHRVEVLEEGERDELGLVAGGTAQQLGAPEAGNLAQLGHDLGAVMRLVPVGDLGPGPAAPHPSNHAPNRIAGALAGWAP